MPEENWVEVGTATTNRIPDSNVDIFLDLDGPPICPNMTDAEFRKLVMALSAEAVELITTRSRELASWTPAAKQRVSDWFGGRCDEGLRDSLFAGLGRLGNVMSELQPKNFVRESPEAAARVGCTPATKNENTDASVCKPDTKTHQICIHPHFCGLRDRDLHRDSKITALIHECTHFNDTFSSDDAMYGISVGLKFWAQNNVEKAIRNADSITAYITFDR